MKILFIGDYSNLHTTLARELRKMGHQADVISDGCGYMNLQTQFYLSRQKGAFGSFRYLYDLFNLLPKLKGYDVVQLINTNFLDLKPGKIKYFYDRIREQNKSMFLTLAGNDYFYCKACFDAKIFRYSEFRIGNEFTPAHKAAPEHLYGWLSNNNKHWAEYLINSIDGAMAVLPEYYLPMKNILGEKLTFTNLPIDLNEIPNNPRNFVDDKVTLLVAMRSGMEEAKGTKTLHKIALEIESEMPDKVRVDLVRDVSLKEFLDRVSGADIILDQLYSYSPAMTALYAMAMKKVAATGAQPEYYEAIGNPENKPIFSLSPFDQDIKPRLIRLIEDRDKIRLMGLQGREIVEQNNDSRIVAERFLSHWNAL